jgi:hypothetical protein
VNGAGDGSGELVNAGQRFGDISQGSAQFHGTIPATTPFGSKTILRTSSGESRMAWPKKFIGCACVESECPLC